MYDCLMAMVTPLISMNVTLAKPCVCCFHKVSVLPMNAFAQQAWKRIKQAAVDASIAAVGMTGLVALCYVLSIVHLPGSKTSSREVDFNGSATTTTRAPEDRYGAMVWLVGSFGASVTLLLACGHSEMARPYAAIMGNGVSAVVGVAVQQMLGATSPMWAAMLAVAVAVGVMSCLKALHPPGGATALIAVIGGPAVHRLGWWYPLCPILLGTLWLLACVKLHWACTAGTDRDIRAK